MLSRSRCCSSCCSPDHKDYSVARWCRKYSPMTGFLIDNGFLIVSMILAALLALSLYLPLMAGQLSLASPGFYALGGYIAAFMSTKVFPSADGSFPVSLLLLEMALAGSAAGLV